MRTLFMRPGRFLSIFCSLFVLASCNEDSTPIEYDRPPHIEERVIRDTDFVKNKCFFLDSPFAGPGKFSPSVVGKLDLYRSHKLVPHQTPPVGTWARAFVDSLGDGSGIGQGLDSELHYFKMLTLPEDYFYVLDAHDLTTVIGIELAQPLSEGEALAAAYINADGDTVGAFDPPVFSTDKDDPLFFELIWPSLPAPDGPYGFTWSHMMRHIYDLGLSNIDGNTLEIAILDHGTREDLTVPEGSTVPWIRIFGLDRTDTRGTGLPDGKVDLLSGVVDLIEGRLTFPVLTPFNPPADSVASWTDGEFSFTGMYENMTNPSLYTVQPNSSEFQNKFEIRRRAAREMP